MKDVLAGGDLETVWLSDDARDAIANSTGFIVDDLSSEMSLGDGMLP